MKLSRKWLILIFIFIGLSLAVLAVFLNRDFFAHYFKNYEIIERERLTEHYIGEYDGLQVFYAEGDLDNRDLWINGNDWNVPNYTPQKVNDRQEAIEIAIYIKTNSDYTKYYSVTEYVISGVLYDTRYDVWHVVFSPPDVPRGSDTNYFGTALGVIFRGYNGKILYIGPC